MIFTKRNTFHSLLVALLFSCLIANGVRAARMTRSKPAAATKTSNSTATATAPAIVPVTEADSVEEISSDATTNEKQTVAVQPTQTDDAISSLSVWGIVRSVWNWIRDDLSESLLGADDDESEATSAIATSTKPIAAAAAAAAAVEGRTFGKIRRLQMALIPIIFKFGVLSAMVAFLVVLGMKSLFLLKLLVLMNAAAILAKFLTLKSYSSHEEHPPAAISWGYSNWNPHTSNQGWAPTAPAPAPQHHHQAPSKEIHLHIHGAQTQPQVSAYSTYGNNVQSHSGGWERRNDPYAAYEPAPITEVDIENELNNQGPMSLLPTKYPANHRY